MPHIVEFFEKLAEHLKQHIENTVSGITIKINHVGDNTKLPNITISKIDTYNPDQYVIGFGMTGIVIRSHHVTVRIPYSDPELVKKTSEIISRYVDWDTVPKYHWRGWRGA